MLLSCYCHIFKGDENNQIHFEGYQVSNQCMALVNDECLVPTKDAPELGYIKQSSNDQYVPDVFYKVLFSQKILFSNYENTECLSFQISAPLDIGSMMNVTQYR